MKIRVVLDTSVLVSGILGGTGTTVLERWRAGEFILVLSLEIYEEYVAVLSRPKFGLPGWMVQELLEYVREHSEWVTPGRRVSVVRDPSDNKFLEAAVCIKVDWIVSGDKDLLDLGEFEGVPIVPAHQFLQEM